MARTLPGFGAELVQEIEAAWARPQSEWERQRLLVVRLIAQHELTSGQIANVADVSRKTVFNHSTDEAMRFIRENLAVAAQ